MAKNKAHPHHSKPYDQKMAERAAARHAMRSGGQLQPTDQLRPDSKAPMPNPREESKSIGGPDAERNPIAEKEKSRKSDKAPEAITEQAKTRMNNGPSKDEI